MQANNLVFTTNPGFINLAGTTNASDFDLVSGSQLIDKGTNLSEITSDFLDRPAPAGTLDVGAFEYQNSTSGGASGTGGTSAKATGGALATGGTSAKATGGAPAVGGSGTGGSSPSGVGGISSTMVATNTTGGASAPTSTTGSGESTDSGSCACRVELTPQAEVPC